MKTSIKRHPGYFRRRFGREVEQAISAKLAERRLQSHRESLEIATFAAALAANHPLVGTLTRVLAEHPVTETFTIRALDADSFGRFLAENKKNGGQHDN